MYKKIFMTLALVNHTVMIPIQFVTGEKTPLMFAAETGNITHMQKLINEGADVNAVEGWDQPRMGYPVLRYAIDSKSVESVKLLLKYGADANNHTTSPIIHTSRRHANVRNLPLLSHAIYSNAHIEIVQLLIEHGADVNEKTISNEWTPLMIAAYIGNTQAAQVLMQAGADYAARSCD